MVDKNIFDRADVSFFTDVIYIFMGLQNISGLLFIERVWFLAFFYQKQDKQNGNQSGENRIEIFMKGCLKTVAQFRGSAAY